MGILSNLFGGVLGVIWMLGGPVTYIVNVVDTWSGNTSVLIKLLISLTLEVVLAAIWPITWAIWTIQYASGSNTTPLTAVLGF